MKKFSKILIELSKWDRCKVPIYNACASGKRIPIIKTLLSSICINECKYCALRRGRVAPRERWNINKLVDITLKLWKRGLIEGLFLSSSVYSDPEVVVEDEIEVARMLRERGFTGYIHLRLMPATPKFLIWEAAEVADRIGVNLESMDPSIFYDIAPDKGDYRLDLLDVLEECYSIWRELGGRRNVLRAGVDTQVIIGVGETDETTIRATYDLISRFKLKRIYYSPFEPVPNTPLEKRPQCPQYRATLLYQIFFLIRDYGFKLEEILPLLDDHGMLPPVGDIKKEYAKKNPDLYPVDLKNASREEILRVPGIGPRLADKIINLRESGRLSKYELVSIMGLKRAKSVMKYVVL
ncbi:MAG: radical SAM protein [Thermoprotei archaeon]|nr:MAG: radical SAM protein [Thermoprotei archaeon]